MPPEFGPEEFARASCVSRETLARLKIFAGSLSDWNARHNLVSRASLNHVWHRHMWDSAQLAPLVPHAAKSLVDLGSGAGFPGLILAILLRERSIRTVLFESTRKKCTFLQTAAENAGVEVEVRCTRIEKASPEIFDVVTARACAPLDKLLTYAKRFQGPNTVSLFLKGQSVASELTEASKSWKMRVIRHPSETDRSGTILEIRELVRA